MTVSLNRFPRPRSVLAGLALCGAALVASTGASQASFVFGLESAAPAGITELMAFGQGDKNAHSFDMNIGGNHATELAHVVAGAASTVLVDVANGFANIKPDTGILTQLTFAPVSTNLNSWGDFFFRGQLVAAGTVTVTITDILNNVFTGTSASIAANTDFASFGGWSIDGDIIKRHDDRHRRLQGTEADSRARELLQLFRPGECQDRRATQGEPGANGPRDRQHLRAEPAA